jgi:hypothetical protein
MSMRTFIVDGTDSGRALISGVLAISFTGAIVTSDKDALPDRSSDLPVFDKSDPDFFQRLSDFIICFSSVACYGK